MTTTTFLSAKAGATAHAHNAGRESTLTLSCGCSVPAHRYPRRFTQLGKTLPCARHGRRKIVDFPTGQAEIAAHAHNAGRVTNSPADHIQADTQRARVSGGNNFPTGQTSPDTQRFRAGREPNQPFVHDTLYSLAEMVADLEEMRKANANRLRQLTNSGADKDGHVRGLGLTEDHPVVASTGRLLAGVEALEADAVKALEREFKRSPLGPWVQETHGVGLKQAARLLATIGDPYIRPPLTREDGTIEPARPRLVSELWKYAGYAPGDKRRKGQKVNWSTQAKTRAFLIAEKCVQTGKQANSPYYELYAKRKDQTALRVHNAPCAQCGGAGKAEAAIGQPWKPGHRHADALRIVAKRLLRDLWAESKRLHEGAEK